MALRLSGSWLVIFSPFFLWLCGFLPHVAPLFVASRVGFIVYGSAACELWRAIFSISTYGSVDFFLVSRLFVAGR